MAPATRQFNIRIWGLALGYFSVYAPYSALIKVVTSGLWPGIDGPVSGFQLLPSTVISTAVVVPLIVSALGWWKYARVPSRVVLLSGFGTATIIATTTLAYASSGVSILLALLLLRGGVLTLAPLVDLFFNRRVRWFSWLALAFTLTGVLVALADVSSYQMTVVAAANIAAYLAGYLLRLPCINAVAKCDDERVTRRYFVEEQMVAMILLVAVPGLCAVIGAGPIMMDVRSGFTGFFVSRLTVPGLLVGALYACLYFFGTLIYLDRRENTFCIPLNRCASVLSAIVATYALVFLAAEPAPSLAQLSGAGLIVVALLLLSPLHHVERYFARAPLVRGAPQRNLAVSGIHQMSFLFVCSGNTCRSPMAAAIGNAEIAARFQVVVGDALQGVPPFEVVAPMRALSAGLSARAGAPMTPESQHALRELGIPVTPHSATNVTVELLDQVQKVFCMTKAHHRAVVHMVPAAAAKTECLDPDGDVEDPIGRGLAAYVSCAQRIHGLVRLRFDELSLQGGPGRIFGRG